MAPHHAHFSCVLRLNPRCDACKQHTFEVLGSIDGVYDFSIDAEQKTVTIIGEVDPTFCIKALARCGIHAELVRANLSHPRMSSGTMGAYGHNYPIFGRSYHDHYPSHSLGYYGDPYRRALPEGMWHDYPTRSALPYYSSYNTTPCYGGSPSYYDRPYGRDYQNYNHYYGHEGSSMCCIM